MDTNWRKSSHSRMHNCLEVGRTCDGGAAVRDTKHRSTGYFAVSLQQWASFLEAVKVGRFSA